MNGWCTILSFSKEQRASQLVLVTELFALMKEFDAVPRIAHTLSVLIRGSKDLTLYIDICSLHALCATLAHETERHLQIDLAPT